MVLYNYAVNGEGGINPHPSSSDEAPSQATPPELEGEEEERRRRQLLDDEEMARQLQEEEDQETNRLIARLRQEEPVPHTLAQSPPPAYNAIEEEERRRRREREREEEEEEILIPCDVCGASIRFEDYQKHMVCDLESYCNLMCSIKILRNFEVVGNRKIIYKWPNVYTCT